MNQSLLKWEFIAGGMMCVLLGRLEEEDNEFKVTLVFMKCLKPT